MAEEVAPKLDTLLTTTLEGVDGTDVIVSRVEIPPNSELPRHWHPGEEFFYVIEGSVTLKRRGQPDVVTVRGDSQKIAPGVIHSGESGKEGAELVIFRVHASGEPERYLVDGWRHDWVSIIDRAPEYETDRGLQPKGV